MFDVHVNNKCEPKSRSTCCSLTATCVRVGARDPTCPLPQSHAQELFVIHMRGNPSLILCDQIFGNFASFSPQSDPKHPFGLPLYVAYHFFSEPGPRKDQCPQGIFERIPQFFLNYFHISHNSSFPFESHTMSFNIDMKMILPLKSDGSHCDSPIIC